MEDIKLALILAQMINFWIIYFLYKKFLAEKLSAAIIERREQMKNLKDSEGQVKEKLALAQAKADALIREWREKSELIQKNAEDISKKQSEKAMSDAKRKAEGIVEWAHREIEKERLDMIEGLKDKIVTLSMKINEKIFSSTEKNKEFIEKEVSSLKI